MKKLLLVTTALTALLAGPAHADPISGIATVFTAMGASAATAVALAQVTFGVGLSLISSALTGAMTDKPKVDVSMSVDIGDDTALSFVVGDYATAGKRKYLGSWGPNTRFITEVIEVSCLPQGLSRLWVNDDLANIDYAGGEITLGGVYPVGYAIRNFDSKGAPRCWIRYHDGTQTAADPQMLAAFSGDANYPWTSDFIGTGKSYAVITSCYDKDTLTSYPSFLFELEPLPVYDPRLDSTAGGLGPHRWGVRSTYSPSRNPAVLAYNIARGIYLGEEWIFGGRNMPAWRLPFDEWVAAMNACDDLVDLDDGTREPAFRAGAEITVDMEPLAVMEELGRAANMRFAEVGGMLKPVVGLPGAAVLGITDEDIIITEGQSFQPFYTASETFNAISATYPEPGEKWTSKDAPEYLDIVSMSEDDGRYLPTSVTYPAAPFAQQVQRLMRAQMLDYRRMRRHTFQLPPEAYGLEPLVDMISWTSARNGYVDKTFVVESVTKAAGMNVLVTIRECDPGDYDWSSDWQQPVVIVPPTNVIPFTQTISGFTAVPVAVSGDGGQQRPAIQVSCTGDESGVTDIRLQVRRLGEAAAQLDVSLPFDEPYSWLITDVLPATGYQVRGQLLSDLTGITDWSGWITVTTADIRLGPSDLQVELREALSDLQDWIDGGVGDLPQILADLTEALSVEQDERVAGAADLADKWRETIDNMRRLAAEVIDLGAASHEAREEIRQSLSAQVGAFRAAYDEQIVVFADADRAAALRITTLEARSTNLSAEIQQVSQAQVDGDEALALLITNMSVGTVSQFDAARIWHFDTSSDGWSGGAWSTGGFLMPTGDVLSPVGLDIDGVRYAQLRLRVLRSGTPAWTGTLRWWVAGVEASMAIPEPAWNGDEGLITLSPGWAGLVAQIGMSLPTSGISIDWVAIGRPAPGASSADLVTLQQAMIDGDSALASSIAQLQTDLATTDGKATGAASAVEGLETRVEATETGLTATTTALTALQNTVNDAETGNAALADAIDLLSTEIENGDGSQLVQSEAIRALQSAVRQVAAEGVESGARNAEAQQSVREYIASASQSLSTRIDLTDEEVEIVAQAVTKLQAAIPDLATADALEALQTVVAQQGTTMTALAQSITNLQTQIDGKASTTALSSLQAEVTSQGNTITSQGTAITALQGEVSGKASVGAVSTLTTRVEQAELDIEAGANAQTALQAVVDMFEASGLFRVEVLATPSGALSRIGLKAAATNGESAGARAAALFLEAIAGGTSRVVVQADTFAIADGTGRIFPFYVDASGVYISSAFIKDLSVDTIKIADAAVTNFYTTSYSGTHSLNMGGERSLLTLSFPAVAGEKVILFATYRIVTWRRGTPGDVTAITNLRLNGTGIASGSRDKTITDDLATDSGLTIEWVTTAVSRTVATTGTQTLELRGDGSVPNGASVSQAGLIELIAIRVKK